jgi:hypothetical protein
MPIVILLRYKRVDANKIYIKQKKVEKFLGPFEIDHKTN